MIPAPLRGTHPLVKYINQLREEILASRLVSFVGGNLERGPTGTKIEANSPPGASVVYVKCCLADSSEAYLPVVVRGVAYTANAGTTTALPVTTGNVPDGETVLE
jgi:hypothetical protein